MAVFAAILMCVAGLGCFLAAGRSVRRRRQSFRWGPARWLATLGLLLFGGGLINLTLALS